MKGFFSRSSASCVAAAFFLVGSNAFADSFDNCNDRASWMNHIWDHYNAREYGAAAADVDQCLPNWLANARFMQHQIESSGADCPPVGIIPTNEHPPIFANGILNDVGTALWIKGKSEHLRGNPSQARDSYQQCEALKCARTFDHPSSFWSPSLDCGAQLFSINGQ